jgi:hypothetical protein
MKIYEKNNSSLYDIIKNPKRLKISNGYKEPHIKGKVIYSSYYKDDKPHEYNSVYAMNYWKFKIMTKKEVFMEMI